MTYCTAAKTPHYPLAQAGVWADCVRLRKPVVHNDYPHLREKKGLPAGHFTLHRHMSVPLFDEDRIVAVAGVGNKKEPYDETDVRQLTLFMNSLWRILKEKRTDTERKVLAAELARSNKELEHFAYVASHDLQEPLRKIASFTELLAGRYKEKLDDKAGTYIGYIVDGAHRMQTLINDLLSFSRVTTRGKEFVAVDCNALVQRVLSDLELVIQKSGARVLVSGLPSVAADEIQLGQVFQNLIGNAIKYQSKDRAPAVHVSAAGKDNEWLFSVRDNGIGIDPRYFDRIFLLFQRLHSREEYSGTGMGLAIVKKIVERHGGRVWVESEPGKGSTFFFTLPVQLDAPA
jgi:light-regulated signal transduction histidine kinase (bacteriophytochrome)